MALLMSFHPQHCRNIFAGLKTLEARNMKASTCYPSAIVYVYETRPRSAIVGKITLCGGVGRINRRGVMYYKSDIRITDPLSELCLTMEELRHYLGKNDTIALQRIDKVTEYTNPIEFSCIGRSSPPITYYTLTDEEVQTIELNACNAREKWIR